jgi:hypothetical protein
MMPSKAILRTTVFLVATTGFAFLANAQSIPKAGANFTSITSNGAWTWYGNPVAVHYEGKYKKTYMGWISNNGTISVGSYNHETGDTATKVIRTGYQVDDHCHPSILMRPDGRLMVFFTGHDGGTISLYVSTNPEDISQFTQETGITDGNGIVYCYPNPMWLSAEGDSGRLYVFYRSLHTNPCFTYSDDWGKTWRPTKQYYANSDDPDLDKVYVNCCSNGIDEIHMAIEKGHRAGYCPCYYMKYKKGAFYQASGALIATVDSLPILNTKIDTMQDPLLANSHGSSWDIALDKTGNPVVVYDQFKDANNHLYYYFRWTGTAWFKKQLVNSGADMGGEDGFAGGVTLDHENTNNVYMSRQINGMHEIDKWTTSDGGTTWDSMAITRGSAKKNTRPIVPIGHKANGKLDVIWMYGDYTGWAGGFNTAVKMYPFNETVAAKNKGAPAAKTNAGPIRLSRTGISVDCADPARSSLKIFTLDGRMVENLTSLLRTSRAGSAFIPFSQIHHASGAYFVELTTGNSGTTQQRVTSGDVVRMVLENHANDIMN